VSLVASIALPYGVYAGITACAAAACVVVHLVLQCAAPPRFRRMAMLSVMELRVRGLRARGNEEQAQQLAGVVRYARLAPNRLPEPPLLLCSRASLWQSLWRAMWAGHWAVMTVQLAALVTQHVALGLPEGPAAGLASLSILVPSQSAVIHVQCLGNRGDATGFAGVIAASVLVTVLIAGWLLAKAGDERRIRYDALLTAARNTGFLLASLTCAGVASAVVYSVRCVPDTGALAPQSSGLVLAADPSVVCKDRGTVIAFAVVLGVASTLLVPTVVGLVPVSVRGCARSQAGQSVGTAGGDRPALAPPPGEAAFGRAVAGAAGAARASASADPAPRGAPASAAESPSRDDLMVEPCTLWGLHGPQMWCMAAKLVALAVVGFVSPLLAPPQSPSSAEAITAAWLITVVCVVVCVVSFWGRPWHQAYAWRRWPQGMAAAAAIMAAWIGVAQLDTSALLSVRESGRQREDSRLNGVAAASYVVLILCWAMLLLGLLAVVSALAEDTSAGFWLAELIRGEADVGPSSGWEVVGRVCPSLVVVWPSTDAGPGRTGQAGSTSRPQSDAQGSSKSVTGPYDRERVRRAGAYSVPGIRDCR